jgi:UDP-GlcNAc:undecaprenyl-phosphate GlcNAc-1-phosphate transferase
MRRGTFPAGPDLSVLQPSLAPLLFWFCLAFAISVVLVPICQRVAIRRGYVAKPREDRWHTKPTALLGGIAIAATVLGGAALSGDLQAMLLPATVGGLMFVVGLADDLLSLKPSTKLIAQIALASLLVFFHYRLQWTTSLTLDALLTIVWIVGITNAFNLLDNMDGLCAGIALFVGAALLASHVDRGLVTPQTRYLALVLGSCSGFLVYNIHPASIFMGDGGSLFLGITLAALTLTADPLQSRSNVLSIVAAPVLALLIPIFDTTLVTTLRLLSGRRVSQGGRDHSSHRLVAIGLSERVAVRVLWALGAAAGLIGFAIRRFSSDWAGLVAAVFILAMVVFAVYLAHVRVYEESDEAVGHGTITPVVANFMYKRRVAEVLLDMCLISIAYYAAYRLRFEGTQWSLAFPFFLQSLPLVLAGQLIALFVVGAYRGVWRYFSLMDGVVFVKGVLLGTVAVVVAILYLYRFENYSRGVFVIDAALLLLMLGGSRASFRMIGEFASRRRVGTRLVIYGAGDGGTLTARELLNGYRNAYQMIGFIDDDPMMRGRRVQGYPVFGGCEELLDLVERQGVDAIVISAREFEPTRLRALEATCQANGVSLARVHFDFEELVARL